jgi:hypothetical protein
MRDTQQLLYGYDLIDGSKAALLCQPNFARSLAEKMRWEPRLCGAYDSQGVFFHPKSASAPFHEN